MADSIAPTRKKRKVLPRADGTVLAGKEPTPVSDGPAGMHSLSPEMLLKLFACLDWRQLLILRQVCKLWKETCRSTSPSVSLGQHDHLSCIYWLFPRVKCLTLASADDDEDEQFPNERIMVEKLRPLCTFRHLTKLVLTRVVQKDQPRNLEIMIQECDHVFKIPTLEELVFDHCRFLAWEMSMVSGTPNLRKLIVKGGFGDDHIFIGGNLSSLKSVQNTLTHLSLDGCGNVEGSFADLAEFPHLESLSLEGTIDIETHDVSIQPGSFPSLKDLDGDAYAHVAAALEKSQSTFTFDRVKSLVISAVSEFSLSLIRFAPNLKELYCYSKAKGSLSELACVQDNLQVLHLPNCHILTGSIADLRNFKHLEDLILSQCRKLAPIAPCLQASDLPCLQASDLPSLKSFSLQMSLVNVGDARHLMPSLLLREHMNLSAIIGLGGHSPGYYQPNPTPTFVLSQKASKLHDALSYSPFTIDIVRIGSRVGWRWCCKHRYMDVPKKPYYFETNWLNDAQNGSDEYKEYCESVEKATKRRLGPFVGMYEPPKTKEVYEELVINYIRNHQRTK